jgi:uncharacterized membrane protein
MGVGFRGLGLVYMIIFWIIVIAAGVWLFSQLFLRSSDNAPSGGTSSPYTSPDPPQEILKRQYASGKITKAEYNEIRRDLDA